MLGTHSSLVLSLSVTIALLWGTTSSAESPSGSPVKIAVFDVDATPPLGSPMAYDPVKRLDELTLRCRGIAMVGIDKPIVLCAVDWIGIANEGHDAFRDALAEVVGTTRDRVAVHALHQHDAPGCDFTAERLMKELGISIYPRFEGTFHRRVIARAADALRSAVATAVPATHFALGAAEVREVASQRRILGPEGKVVATRTSSDTFRESSSGTGRGHRSDGDDDRFLESVTTDRSPQLLRVSSAKLLSIGNPSPDFSGIARSSAVSR